ncbi:MAG: creatininase family protein [Planctomycetota bacterium]
MTKTDARDSRLNVRYEELRPRDIVVARKRCPVAYLPIGGVEWHGVHLPVGNDTLKAHALCVRIAELTGGLVFPPLFWGENRERALMEINPESCAGIAGEMGLPREDFLSGYMHESADESDFAYTRLLVHCMHEIASLGFKVIVISAGHYPLIHHARAAIELFELHRRYQRPVKAWAFTGFELVREEFPHAGDHAAHWETSLLMELRPELVDLTALPGDPTVTLVGVSGLDPRVHASREIGARGVEAISVKVAEKVRTMLAELGDARG